MKTSLLILLAFPAASYAACTYNLDPASVKVEWTAFKTTAKTPVGGHFTKVTAEPPVAKKEAPFSKWQMALKGTKAKIALTDAAAISTNNPARDQTLFEHFFAKVSKNSEIDGQVVDVKDEAGTGQLEIDLKMNGKSEKVPFKFSYAKDGSVVANGTIDVLKFGLKNAFEDLHKNCEALHKGADGVSKTWSEVDIKIQAKINENCGS